MLYYFFLESDHPMPAKTIEEILKETKIYQILRPKLVTVLPNVPLKDALALMHREKAGYIVVADAHLKVVQEHRQIFKIQKVSEHDGRVQEPARAVGLAVHVAGTDVELLADRFFGFLVDPFRQ